MDDSGQILYKVLSGLGGTDPDIQKNEDLLTPLSQLCRICALPNEYLIPIFEGEGQENSLADKIHSHLPIRVNSSDDYPDHVCYQCASTLLAFHDLVDCCKQANITLTARVQLGQSRKTFTKDANQSKLGDASQNNKERYSLSFRSFHRAQGGAPATASLPLGADVKLEPDSNVQRHNATTFQNEHFFMDETLFPAQAYDYCHNGKDQEEEDVDNNDDNTGDDNDDDEQSNPNPVEEEVKSENEDFGKQYVLLQEIVAKLKEHVSRCHKSSKKYKLAKRRPPRIHDKETKAELELVKVKVGGKIQYQCHVCNKAFPRANNFLRHKIIHSEKLFPCEICGRKFRILGYLKNHMKKIHSIESKQELVNYQKAHPKSESAEDKQLEDAKTGGRKFFDYNAIEKVKVLINGEVFYQCEICDKKLSRVRYYLNHITVHTGEKKFICHHCGRSFRLVTMLRVHMRVTHENIKDFSCDVCPRKFGTKNNLLEHQHIHTGERPYVCSKCGKRFKQKSALYIHNRSHTDYFPFKCAQCEAKFRIQSQLNYHMIKHTGETPFSCDFCGKAFPARCHLNQHRKCHLEIRPYPCRVCDKAFRYRNNLNVHLKNCHKIYQECGSKAKRKQDTDIDRKQDKVLDLEVGVKRAKKKGFANLRNHCALSGAELRELFRKKESVVTCHLCSKSFISGKQLEAHVAKCTEAVCSKCKVKFSSVGLLASHRADCAVFACQTCPKRFVSQDTLAAHQLSKHATAKCHFCLAYFTSDAECYAHKSDYHNFECDVCLKVFLYTIDQMKNKFTKTKGKIICDLCERTTVLEESNDNDEVELEEESEQVPVNVSGAKRIKVEIENQIYPIKLEASQLNEDPLENEGDSISQEDAFYAILPENSFGDGEDTTMQYQCCYCKGVYNSFNELNNHLIDSHNLQLQELSTDSQVEKDSSTNAVEKFQSKIDELFDTSMSVMDFESQTQFSCTVCEKVFKSSVTYRKHAFRSHKLHLLFGLDKQFHCQNCRVDRNSLCELNKHLYSRHESNVKCDHCDHVFTTKREKKIHILNHHPDQPAFSCLDCASKFTSHNELKQHCSWHWFHEIVECRDCNKKIKGKKKFKIHMNYHKIRQNQGDKEIICPECGKGLSSRSSLQAHLRYVHRGGNEETILCGDCGLLVKVRRFNRHHERMHSQGNLFRCHICTRSFFAKELLRQHMDTHIDGRPHECDQCPAAFKQVRNLRMHKRNYHADNTTSCKMCNVNFDTPEAYAVHRLTYHKRTPRPIKLDAEEGFLCPLCPKTLKSSRAVATHRRIAHEKHLHVKCDLCNLEFPFIRQLQSHMTSHTEPKPDLSCGFCHRTFTTLGSLNSHIKWVHVGERNFPCSYCPAKFKRKDAQIVHERTHTDERPYSCGVCQRRFRQRTDCKRHEAKHSMPGFRYNKPHRMRPRPLPEVVIEEVVEQEGGLLLQVPGEDNQAAAFLSYIVQN